MPKSANKTSANKTKTLGKPIPVKQETGMQRFFRKNLPTKNWEMECPECGWLGMRRDVKGISCPKCGSPEVTDYDVDLLEG